MLFVYTLLINLINQITLINQINLIFLYIYKIYYIELEKLPMTKRKSALKIYLIITHRLGTSDI